MQPQFRRIISTKIVLMGLLLIFYSSVMAFTFRLASEDVITDMYNVQARGTPDIPTPQFFRLLVQQNTLTLVLEKPFDDSTRTTPRVQEIPVHTLQPALSPLQTPSDQQLPQLSGIEVLLLRNTQTLVDETTP